MTSIRTINIIKNHKKKVYPESPPWLIDPLALKNGSNIEKIKKQKYDFSFNPFDQEELIKPMEKFNSSIKDFIEIRELKKVKVVKEPPKEHSKPNINICKATTMGGKQCTFKATCGDFCKKHRINS